jgi:hypothetical protein
MSSSGTRGIHRRADVSRRWAPVKDARAFLCYCSIALCSGNSRFASDHGSSPREVQNGEYQRKKPSQFPMDAFMRHHRSPRKHSDDASRSGFGYTGDATSGHCTPEIMPFRCDSLDPQVCFDIYGRILKSTPWLFYGTVGGPGLRFSNEGWLSRWTAGTSVERKFEYRPGTPRFEPAPLFK